MSGFINVETQRPRSLSEKLLGRRSSEVPPVYCDDGSVRFLIKMGHGPNSRKILSISKQAFKILDPHTELEIENFPIGEIKSWKVSPDDCHLVYAPHDIQQPRVVRFSTKKQHKEILNTIVNVVNQVLQDRGMSNKKIDDSVTDSPLMERRKNYDPVPLI
eukprot:TRINITY_DN1641_c0_g1_i1.p1 TRINITY_DN1641_c0_g1~~TRINITY_DN1641_c0_g1_i1.p1  ORF type:complete len:160 (+),score=31.65 TRINITY_DN1641_c0_g1_i1:135-614(+)